MKRLRGGICAALLIALPLFWAGCASTPTQESTGEYVDDAVITAKVKTELASDKLLTIYQISVETYKGVVQLSGFVNTREQSDEAATVTRKVRGVREVKNSLVLKTQ